MCQLYNSNFLYLLLISLSGIAQHVNSYRGFDPPNADTYIIRLLTEETICHPLGSRLGSIRIGDLSIHSLNSPIKIGSSYMFDRWIDRTSDLKCRFTVKVRKGEKLMAVIQNMAFRKINGECLDYVQFRRSDEHSTEKFCDQFDLQKQKHSTDSKFRHFGEYDIDGEIETTIFVSKRSVRRNEMPINITIVYTPYNKGCNFEDYHNSNKRDMIFFPGVDVCLPEDYMCDGIYNCLPGICFDEDDCSGEIFSNGIGSKVTIAAVSTILLGFIIFLMGLWICRRQKKLCWSPDCAGPDINEDRPNNGERSSNSANQSVSTAPMLEVSVLSSTLNKDLPPSYDSLFPEHTNPSST